MTETSNAERLLQQRLDYAWRYFDSAAQKRMQFINFFVVLVGILANAYVAALKESLHSAALGVCLFGVACSITFMFLDSRMLVFVDRSLAVLETLEREHLFPDNYCRRLPNGDAGDQLGLARTEPDKAAKGGRDKRTGAFYTKVWFWVRIVVQGGAAVGFGVGAVAAIAKL